MMNLNNNEIGGGKMRGEIAREDMLNYLLAGNSLFTIMNAESGNHATFRITNLKRIDPHATRDLWFVKVLSGGADEKRYMFLGSIRKDGGSFIYRHSPKSKAHPENIGVKVIVWFLRKIQNGTLPEFFHMFHEGRCGICGKTLTDPESIKRGYGPDCWGRRSGGF